MNPGNLVSDVALSLTCHMILGESIDLSHLALVFLIGKLTFK